MAAVAPKTASKAAAEELQSSAMSKIVGLYSVLTVRVQNASSRPPQNEQETCHSKQIIFAPPTVALCQLTRPLLNLAGFLQPRRPPF